MSSDFVSFEKLKRFSEIPLIIWRENNENDKTWSYNDIIQESKKLVDDPECFNFRYKKIGLQIQNSPSLISVILGILNIPSIFVPLHSTLGFQEIVKSLVQCKAKYLFTDVKKFNIPKDCDKLTYLKCWTICSVALKMYEVNVIVGIEEPELCYSIQTSGSTGTPKVINVPMKCILPNIINLSKIFQLTSNDVIFLSAPPTFDPYVVDLFLAFFNGASLLLTTKAIQLSSELLINVLLPNNDVGATLMQMTPSRFKMFHLQHLERIFSKDSLFRILVLGGEPFPSCKFFSFWQDWKSPNRKKVFNIYGITEVSCWSTIQAINTENSDSDVSLGKPIDSAICLEVRNIYGQVITEGEGELFIGSDTRKCAIGDEDTNILLNNKIIFRSTGDIVHLTNANHLFYKGRTNEVVKRYGHKTNLRKIENTLRKNAALSDVCCVFDQENCILIAFLIPKVHSNDPIHGIVKRLCENLEMHEKPDDFFPVTQFPVSCHGKVSKSKLMEIYKNKKTSFKKSLPEYFKNRLVNRLENLSNPIDNANANDPTSKKRQKTSWHSSFISAGGSSFLALNLVSELEENYQITIPTLIPMLMDDKCSLLNIIEHLEKFEMKGNFSGGAYSDQQRTEIRVGNLNVFWKYDLKKCIDATPSIINFENKNIISVGGHSHLIINIDEENGSVISSLELPDRIESQVVSNSDGTGFVGCYDGNLYRFDIRTGNILWEFESCAMIKCKPLLIENFIIFGNYNKEHNLFCLNIKNKSLEWSLPIGKKGILSSPIKFNDKIIVVCSLDGIVAGINYYTGTIVWEFVLSSPIFSTSSIIDADKIVIAEVSGNIHCYDRDGNEVWSFKAGGNIFSSLRVYQFENDQPLILFGCHDRNVYCLKLTENGTNANLLWTTPCESQIYSTPAIIKFGKKDFVVNCSTKGVVNIIDLKSGSINCSLNISGEIFSSPVIIDHKIFVGCRDNYLYCIELNHN